MPNKKKSPKFTSHPARVEQVMAAFDRDTLAHICTMDEEDFAAEYGMDTHSVPQLAPEDFYHFKDNGSDILAVAHLDTVAPRWTRTCGFIDTADGEVVFSRSLDDRLGAYIILEMLPKLGINVDLLLTVGEEQGRSTARYFEPSKEYNWMIEFDRGGTDVVMYEYDDAETRDLVRQTGAHVGLGSFTDICYLDHLEIKGFNWGVGYEDYHGPRSHAFLDDTFEMVARFMRFHSTNKNTYLPHDTLAVDRRPWWMADDVECRRCGVYYWAGGGEGCPVCGDLERIETVDAIIRGDSVYRADEDQEQAEITDLVAEYPTQEQIRAVTGD
jgi:hypothetical protein